MVVIETATVLSHRKNQDAASKFLDFAAKLPTIFITEELYQASIALFREQAGRGVSVVDCANVVVVQRFGISRLLSFDKSYSKQFGIEAIA